MRKNNGGTPRCRVPREWWEETWFLGWELVLPKIYNSTWLFGPLPPLGLKVPACLPAPNVGRAATADSYIFKTHQRSLFHHSSLHLTYCCTDSSSPLSLLLLSPFLLKSHSKGSWTPTSHFSSSTLRTVSPRYYLRGHQQETIPASLLGFPPSPNEGC